MRNRAHLFREARTCARARASRLQATTYPTAPRVHLPRFRLPFSTPSSPVSRGKFPSTSLFK
ncbi:hypothetical protein J6590_032812 [Homalodisca vitripennis]|nr:hypothetical protein J6590_032812 [Homalodisca vitripennis]